MREEDRIRRFTVRLRNGKARERERERERKRSRSGKASETNGAEFYAACVCSESASGELDESARRMLDESANFLLPARLNTHTHADRRHRAVRLSIVFERGCLTFFSVKRRLKRERRFKTARYQPTNRSGVHSLEAGH